MSPTARQTGEELRADLVGALGLRVGLFDSDSDPELDDHDPAHGAHLLVHGDTCSVNVDIPHSAEAPFLGTYASDGEFRQQPLRRDEVVEFFVRALR